jgi:hypothetical protein
VEGLLVPVTGLVLEFGVLVPEFALVKFPE